VRYWQKLAGDRGAYAPYQKTLHNTPNSLSLRFRMPFNTLRLMEKLRCAGPVSLWMILVTADQAALWLGATRSVAFESSPSFKRQKAEIERVLRQRAFMRTVRCLTVANTLQWIVVQMVPVINGKVEERQQRLVILIRHSTALSYFGAYFSANATPSPPVCLRCFRFPHPFFQHLRDGLLNNRGTRRLSALRWRAGMNNALPAATRRPGKRDSVNDERTEMSDRGCVAGGRSACLFTGETILTLCSQLAQNR
jgi:hypothetical protein